jgi:CubicO group peptidase (beta-lactamase class C family)
MFTASSSTFTAKGSSNGKLFTPLGITHFTWVKDAHGVPYAASGLRLRPTDMMKLGELMLHHGAYRGHQIVPRRWADAATSRQIAVDTGSPCATESKDHPPGLGYLHYGYFWWGGPGCPDQKRDAWFGAIGNGGERITVVPTRDAVIVATAGLYNDPRQGAGEHIDSTH